MRADNAHMLCNSIESCKDDAKPHEFPKNSWEGTKLETTENRKESTCRVFCDSGGDTFDKEKDRKMLGLCTSQGMTDLISSEGKEVRESHLSGKGESLEKGSVFYMDKNVAACDLPEIVVCYKESTYHVVKDICVDEGVPVKEKFLFDEKDYGQYIPNWFGAEDSVKAEKVNNQVEEQSEHHNASTCDSKSLKQEGHMKNDVTSKTSEKAKDTTDAQKSSAKVYADTGKSDQKDLDVTREAKDDAESDIVKDMPMLYASELSVEADSDKHISSYHDSKNLSVREEVATARNVVSKEPLTLADILSTEDGRKPFSNSSKGPEEQSSQKLSGDRSSEKAALVPEVEDAKNSSAVGQVLLSPERADDGAAEGNSSGFKNTEKVELCSGSTSQESSKITIPIEASHDNSEAGLQINDLQKPEPEHHLSRYNFLFEDSNDHPFPSHFPGGFGESSFSAAEPVSGHITYSGPIVVSGSLSVRSDGSTASTRSFAFPVLQSEWNSSPVRMAKADRRRLRSNKGWRYTLLCCKF